MIRLFAAALLAWTCSAFAQTGNLNVTTKNDTVKNAGSIIFSGANRLCFQGSSAGTACLTMPSVASSSAAVIAGALGFMPAPAVNAVLTTPNLGAATAASINNMVLMPTAAGATLSIVSGKVLSVLHSITLDGNDGATLDIGPGGRMQSGAFAPAGASQSALRCATGTVSGSLASGIGNTGICTAVGARVGMVVTVTAETDPGMVHSTATVVANDTVQVKECAQWGAVVPTPTKFQVKVDP